MGADLIFGLLTHPVCLVFWLGLLSTSCFVAYRNPITHSCIPPLRLVTGYFGVFLACIPISALHSYISPDEASHMWHIPPERYWNVMKNEFFSNLMITTMIGTSGIAIVGLPVIFRLARVERASIGWVLLTSIAISITFSLVFSVFFLTSTQPWIVLTFKLIKISAPAHLLMALCFCIGAGLRWQSPRKTA